MIIFFLTLTKQQNEREVAENMFIFMSDHKMESIVHYVSRSGVMWHSVWEYHQLKNVKFRNGILLYELLLLTCSGNWMWNWCNSMTAFCVKLYGDEKTMTYYFPYLKSIFLYTVFPLEKISIVHFISLIVVFFTRKMWL